MRVDPRCGTESAFTYSHGRFTAAGQSGRGTGRARHTLDGAPMLGVGFLSAMPPCPFHLKQVILTFEAGQALPTWFPAGQSQPAVAVSNRCLHQKI